MRQFSDQKKIEYVNVALLVSTAVMEVLKIAVNLIPGFSEFFGSYVTNIAVTQFINIAPFICFFAYCGINVPKEIKVRKLSVGNVLLVLLFGILIQPVLRFFNALSLVFSHNTSSDLVLDLSTQLPYLVAVLLVALVPAVFEETVFRGALFQTYRKANPWRAVVFSGFLFGLAHGNLNQFMYAFVMGIVFALLVEATGSIISTVIIHFFTNFVSVSTVYVLPWAYENAKLSVERAKELGMSEAVELFNYAYGDFSMSAEEWMNEMFGQAANVNLTLGTVILTFLPSAVIFGSICWALLICLARRSGNWNRFAVSFLGADNVPVEKESKGPYATEATTNDEELNGDSTLRIVTVPLMLVIAIGVLSMFVYETLMLLPQAR